MQTQENKKISYRKYAAQNIATFPCHRDKSPATRKGFHDATTDLEILPRLYSSGDYIPGIPTGEINGIVVIDFDNKEYISVSDCIDIVKENYGPLPDTLTVSTQSGGLHFYYSITGETKTKSRSKFLDQSLPIDIRSNGGYVCGPDDHDLYTVIDDDDEIFWTDLRSLCAPLPDWIENFEKQPLLKTRPKIIFNNGKPLPYKELAEIIVTVCLFDPDTHYSDWIKIGQCLHFTGDPNAFHIWEGWSIRGKKYKEGECGKHWKSFKTDYAGKHGPVTIRTLFHMAKNGGKA
ncbi:MAG: bifunctional DNA primase/polymerase [Deltaproteobacteria bacterium]|nr:bifunctional DNA primase/polymerase [Deltaproteobacteria bacterium]